MKKSMEIKSEAAKTPYVCFLSVTNKRFTKVHKPDRILEKVNQQMQIETTILVDL